MSSALQSKKGRSLVQFLLDSPTVSQASSVLKTATFEQAKVIAEIVLNILEGYLSLSAEEKQTFSRCKTLLRNLAATKTSNKARVSLVRRYGRLLTSLVRLLRPKLEPLLK